MTQTYNDLADDLRRYVIEHGPQAACRVIIAILEEQRDGARGKPASTLAAINADVLKAAVGRMMG